MRRGDLCRLQLDPEKNRFIAHFLKDGLYATAEYNKDQDFLESDLIWDSPHVSVQSIMLVLDEPQKVAGQYYYPVVVGGQYLIFQEVELELISEAP